MANCPLSCSATCSRYPETGAEPRSVVFSGGPPIGETKSTSGPHSPGPRGNSTLIPVTEGRRGPGRQPGE